MVAFSLAGSALSRFTGLDPRPIAPVTALLTLAAGFYAAFQPFAEAVGPRRAWTAVAVVVAVGAASEILGLYTGFPFGRYEYTAAWWPVVALPGGKLFPLQLPFAWFLVAGAAHLVVAGRGWPGPATVVLGALLAAVVNIPMEPVMTGPLGYWRWLDGGPMPGKAPVTNFLGWFGTSLVAGAVLWSFGSSQVRDRREPGAVMLAFLGLVLGLGLLA